MKKIITSGDLKRMLPSMPETTERELLNTLQTAPYQKEETIVKKKMSLALVLAMVIILVAAVALAIANWRDTAEEVARMEAEKGYFETWTTTDKAELIRLLSEAGALPGNEKVVRILDSNTPEGEKDQLAGEVMMAYTNGAMDTVTFSSILDVIRGPIETWSQEEKAWYTEMLERNGMLTSEETVYVLPEGEEITEEEAVRIAKEVLRAAYGVTAVELESYTLEATYTVVTWDDEVYDLYVKGNRLWSLIFRKGAIQENPDPTYYHVDITSDGSVLLFDRTTHGGHEARVLPRAGDITKEEAVRIAKETLIGAYGVPAAELDGYTVDAPLVLIDWMPDADEPTTYGDRVWTVSFLQAGEGVKPDYQVEIRSDGELLSSSHAAASNP